jgi:pyridoxal phosphate enzyme (YggS family)
VTAFVHTEQRRAEIADNLARAREEISAACRTAGRDLRDVKLVAVTKTFPATDVCHLAALGVRDVGENRDQDAAGKAVAVAETGARVRWHFVGRLQRNKCRSVAGYADLVHSVDRIALGSALDAAAAQRDDPLPVLMQLSLDGDTSRGGVDAESDQQLAQHLLECSRLRLRGVMAVAPLGWEPLRAFELLAERASKLRAVAPEATEISAGMSNDFAAAISCGATLIRLGSKLLGPRTVVGYPDGARTRNTLL